MTKTEMEDLQNQLDQANKSKVNCKNKNIVYKYRILRQCKFALTLTYKYSKLISDIHAPFLFVTGKETSCSR